MEKKFSSFFKKSHQKIFLSFFIKIRGKNYCRDENHFLTRTKKFLHSNFKNKKKSRLSSIELDGLINRERVNKGSLVDFNIRKELLDNHDKIRLPKIMLNNQHIQHMSLPASPRSSTTPQTDASIVKLNGAGLTPTLIRTKKEPSRLNKSQKVSKFSYVKTSQLNNSGSNLTLTGTGS